MKLTNTFFIGFTALICIATTVSNADVNVRVNFNELNNYGEWVIVPGYGTVWRPDAHRDWRPFTYGHWVYTNDGWLWDSDEPFGWIVCHYGNWFYEENQGWVWLPGYDWSPASVRWYVTDNEVGWAPLSPKLHSGHHQNSIQMQWTFVPVSLFTSFDIHNHLAIRTTLSSERVRAHVNTGPPDRVVIQRNITSPIVRIGINKVHITSRKRPLVRVEVQHEAHSNVEVPVGHKYKRMPVQNQPKPIVNIKNNHNSSVHQEQSNNPHIKTEKRSSRSGNKVQVRSQEDQENQDGNRKNNYQRKKKVKIEVRNR